MGYTLQSYWVTGMCYSFNSLQGSLDSEPTQRRVERSLWEKDKLLHPWPLPQTVACPCRYFLSIWTYIRTWWHYEYETLPYSVKRGDTIIIFIIGNLLNCTNTHMCKYMYMYMYVHPCQRHVGHASQDDTTVVCFTGAWQCLTGHDIVLGPDVIHNVWGTWRMIGIPLTVMHYTWLLTL